MPLASSSTKCIALYFEGPNSFTGEDVLELQGHGGPVVIDMLIKSHFGDRQSSLSQTR